MSSRVSFKHLTEDRWTDKVIASLIGKHLSVDLFKVPYSGIVTNAERSDDVESPFPGVSPFHSVWITLESEAFDATPQLRPVVTSITSELDDAADDKALVGIQKDWSTSFQVKSVSPVMLDILLNNKDDETK